MSQSRQTPVFLLVLLLTSLAIVILNINPASAANERGEGEPKFRLEAKPTVRRCRAGDIAEFDVKITGIKEGGESKDRRGELVFLRVEGLPLEWISQLSPRIGRSDFKSKLTVRTAAESPTGTYNLTVVGVGFGGSANSVTVSVIVEQPGSKPGPKEPYKSELELNVRTDKPLYRIGEEVKIIGGLSTNFGVPIFNATIYLSAVNPAGRLICFNITRTDELGAFYSSFKLTSGKDGIKPLNGTYVVYAAATYNGTILRTHTTFITEYPSYPSVQIESIIILNAEGNETRSMFHQGESMKIRVTVTNYGMALDSSVVWVEVQAPNRIPIRVILSMVPINPGESRDLPFDFKIPLNAEPGIYHVKVYVSDKPISGGGRFIATGAETFIVES
ncbi:MAG: hypothetical protein ACP5K1_02135 [Candidatus Bathyarchaeia archaeon]